MLSLSNKRYIYQNKIIAVCFIFLDYIIMIFGYARVSKLDQNLDRQLDQLKKEGCERIYQEKVTGTRKDRPELVRMMDSLREGVTILVCELTRLSRSVKDLFELVDRINETGSKSKSPKDITIMIR